jgi:hypothetical protein
VKSWIRIRIRNPGQRYLSPVLMLEAEVVGEGDGKAAEDLTLPHLQRPLFSIIYKFLIWQTLFYVNKKIFKNASIFVCYF